MLTLRLVHVLAGIWWTGSAVMFAGFVLPALRASGAAGGRVVRELMHRRRLAVSFMISSLLTIASGLAMYTMIGAGSYRQWITSPMGSTLGLGAIAALIAAALGSGVVAPASRRLAELGIDAAAPQDVASDERLAELRRIERRLGVSSAASAVLLLIAVSAMAMARYV